MRLWVIARAEVWPALQEQKSLRNDRGRRPEYAWLCEEMRLRVPGYAGPSVWWAWHLVDGRSGVAPSGRLCDALHNCDPGTPMVCMAAKVPEQDVLLMDHTLLRRICRKPDYLAFDAAEDQAFRRRYPTPGPEATEAILASWSRIFTPSTWRLFDPAWLGDVAKPGRNVLVAFDELRLEDIVNVTPFTSGRPGLHLPRVRTPMRASS